MKDPLLDRILKNKPLSIGLGFVCILIATLPFIFLRPNNDSNRVPKVTEKSEVTPPSVIVNGEQLYKEIASDIRYKNFRSDLAEFAKSYVKIEDTPVVFTVQKVSKADDKVLLNGKFQKGPRFDMELTNKPHNRISAKVTDTESKKDVSDVFPANSITNQFIQKLPITDPNYSIDYNDITNEFSVALYDRSPDLITTTQSILKKELQIDSLTNIKIGYTFPSSQSADIPPEDSALRGD